MNQAVCVLVQKDDLVLAVARRGTTDQWGLPGGKVDPNEDLKTAAYREFREETLVKFDDPFAHLKRVFERENDGWHSTTFQYTGPLPEELLQEHLYQGDAGPVKFITWQELCNGPFGEYNKRLMLAVKGLDHA